MKMSVKLFLALLFVVSLRCDGNSELEIQQPRPQFDYFVLSMHWPNTFCRIPGNICRRSLPQRFTVHGLWPTRIDGSAIPNCTTQQISDTVLSKYRADLLEYWPDLTQTSFERSKPFWRREYREHGACSIEKFDADEYIERVIRLAKIHDVRAYLRSKRILPNNQMYSAQSILSAIEANTSFRADIQCTTVNRTVYLQEVRICINSNGRIVNNCRGRILNCPRNPYFPASVSFTTAMDQGVEFPEDMMQEKNTTQIMGWKEDNNVKHEDGLSSI